LEILHFSTLRSRIEEPSSRVATANIVATADGSSYAHAGDRATLKCHDRRNKTGIGVILLHMALSLRLDDME
jgi:hypothetical protein